MLLLKISLLLWNLLRWQHLLDAPETHTLKTNTPNNSLAGVINGLLEHLPLSSSDHIEGSNQWLVEPFLPLFQIYMFLPFLGQLLLLQLQKQGNNFFVLKV